MIFLGCVLWGFWLLGKWTVYIRGILVVQRAFSFMNVFRIFGEKHQKISFTLLPWVFKKYRNKLILPYNIQMYTVFFTKTKVVPLRFF